MITLPKLAAEALGSFLASDMKDRFGTSHARLAELIPYAARLALDCIGNSDALYHNVEHTLLVTMAGQQVQKYEKGSNRISASRLQHISQILQVPVPFFFEGAPAASGIRPSTEQTAEASSPSYVRDFLSTSEGLEHVPA
jgi:transcriptional regulator with XRE-family HTH domain